MAVEVLSVTSGQSYSGSIRKAAEILRAGGLVAFPTETVYGLAANAELPDAVARLRRVKGRASEVPLTVHLGRKSDAAAFLTEVPGVGRRLMARAWPGPLTLIFDVDRPQEAAVARGKDPGFLECVYYDGSVGLRLPDCPPACDTMLQAGCVVVASSANRAGQPPPTDAGQVLAGLDDEIDLLLDGQRTRYAGPSTVARVSRQRIEVLRRGILDERTIHKLAANQVLLVCTGNTCRSPMAEGLLKDMLARHLGCAVAELEDHGYVVRSSGTAAVDGVPATPEAVEAMADQGIDICGYRSSALTPGLIEESQVILVMTAGHANAVKRLASDAEGKVHLLGGQSDINDPLGGSLDLYRSCRDQITAGLKERMTEMIL